MADSWKICALSEAAAALAAQTGTAVLSAFLRRGGLLENLCAEGGSCCTGRSDRTAVLAAFFPSGGQLKNL